MIILEILTIPYVSRQKKNHSHKNKKDNPSIWYTLIIIDNNSHLKYYFIKIIIHIHNFEKQHKVTCKSLPTYRCHYYEIYFKVTSNFTSHYPPTITIDNLRNPLKFHLKFSFSYTVIVQIYFRPFNSLKLEILNHQNINGGQIWISCGARALFHFLKIIITSLLFRSCNQFILNHKNMKPTQNISQNIIYMLVFY